MYRRQSVKRTLVNSVSALETIHIGPMHNPIFELEPAVAATVALSPEP